MLRNTNHRNGLVPRYEYQDNRNSLVFLLKQSFRHTLHYSKRSCDMLEILINNVTFSPCRKNNLRERYTNLLKATLL